MAFLSLAAVGFMTCASAGYRTASAQVMNPTLARERKAILASKKVREYLISMDCARVEGVGAQSKERKGSHFAA